MMRSPDRAAATSSVLAWYVERLRRMDARELLHRCASELADVVVAFKLKTVGVRDPKAWISRIEARLRAGVQLPELPWDLERLCVDRADLLAGRFAYGGRSWALDDGTWSVRSQLASGSRDRFSPWLAHRLKREKSDVRVEWEPNRLQFLTGLALLPKLVDESLSGTCVALVHRRLSSWLAQNPVLRGVNYVSAMECAQRLLSVLFASHVLHPYVPKDHQLWETVARIVESHTHLISKRLSLYSSLGNHTVAESVALFLASLTLPIENAALREQQALEALAQACERLCLSDGGLAEQSTAYHALVLDLLFVAIQTGALHGRNMAAFERLHAKGSAFLAALAIGAELPLIGDSDSSYAICPYMKPSWRLRAAGELAPFRLFESSGYTVFRNARAVAIFDHGPLGMAPNFAHGHADALNLMAWIDDRPVLIDPGTFSYASAGGWRDYFRGTSAHNTVSVNGADQARSMGPFLWSDPAHAEVDVHESWPTGRLVIAHHDGYAFLGFIHQRAVLFRSDAIIVVDHLRRLKSQTIATEGRLRWHLAGAVTRQDDCFLHEDTGALVSVSGSRGVMHSGTLAPRGGWRSREYGRLEPTTTLEFPIFEDAVVTEISVSGRRRMDGHADDAQIRTKMAQIYGAWG